MLTYMTVPGNLKQRLKMPKDFFQDLPREIRDMIYRETAFSIQRPAISPPFDDYELLISCPNFNLAVQLQNDPKFLPLDRAVLVNKQFSQEFKEVFEEVQNKVDEGPEPWVMDCMANVLWPEGVPFFKTIGLLRYMSVPPSYRPVPRRMILSMSVLLDQATSAARLDIGNLPLGGPEFTWPQALAQMVVEIGTQLWFCRDPTNLALWADPPGNFNEPHELEKKHSPVVEILIKTRVKQSLKSGKETSKKTASQDPVSGDEVLQSISPEVSLQLVNFLAKWLCDFFGMIGVRIRNGKFDYYDAPSDVDVSQLIPSNHEIGAFAIAFDYDDAVPDWHLRRLDIPSHQIQLRRLQACEWEQMPTIATTPLQRAYAEAHASLTRQMQILGLMQPGETDIPGPIHTFSFPFN